MKRLYMLAITSLLVAACAEDIDNNNLGKPLISFGVNEPYAAVADSNEPAATRSFNATDAFTPGNSLFSNAVYASDADKQSAANRVQVESLEGDYPQELCMLVSKAPWPQPSTATRATENTTAVLNASGKQIGIYSSIYSGNADYSTSSSKFEPTTATAWPTTGSSSTAYDIYAWHPTTFTSTGISMSGQTFTYTLPTTSAAMVDLIGTKESHSYSENNDGSISLTFNHLLAPVCFKLAAGLSGTITSIKFSNIVTTGTYTLGGTHADDATYGYTWTATTTGAYTASVSGTGGASEVQVDGSHYFMMIPQTVAAGVVVTITITDGASQSNTLTYTVPSGGQVWKAGQVTTYTISTSTITSFTLTYPQWTESGGSGTTYGPVDNYDVTTEDYGYVGLFAVDKANKIVISNAKVKITSAASHVGTCDLTDAANTAVLGNYILSQNYAYYVMYPYSTTATGLSTLAAGTTSPGSDADTFFANVTANWTPATDQSTLAKIKTNDLQVAIGTGTASRAFNMSHKMGLAQINMKSATSGSVVETITYSANTSSTAYANTTTTTYFPALNCFKGNVPYNSSTTVSFFVVKLSTQYLFSTPYKNGAGVAQWTIADGTGGVQGIAATDITNGGVYKSINTTVPSFKNIARLYSCTKGEQLYTPIISAKHKLEAWGAQGTCGSATSYGGKGGYTYGFATIGSAIYIYVGESVQSATYDQEVLFGTAYNTGVTTGYHGFPGGGATHIAKNSRGELKNYESYKSDIYIVAGGGGAGESSTYGGAGGGETGQDVPTKLDTHTRRATGGAQSLTGTSSLSAPYITADGSNGYVNGSFGCSGYAWRSGDYGGYGGGGWYGGGGVAYAGSGAGGSGHVGSVDSGETIQGTVANRIPVATASTGYETGHSNSGNARITILPYD